ncbi:cobyrinic acid a,c-diamide synthase [Enterococcus plantarum]|uniref:Cobyrinic acid a,c-diamide synthase n=1 Tax=Enterococcus plantarum TaxID=1077675 RepID=A0A2W3ZEI3_9ENTE|nr:AAA family ATPase [Enterococcus plantarum]OEG08506.1 cobyrinic acid a,c-diamide synthase [Enterococcus plantarum]PZL75680.1 cobyrinic acid a,c-diamide synthase [Enterococcus plantarum]
MEVVSIINYKGGVGKTTITANLAAELVFRGKRVLVIDLDPQTNLTFSFVKVDEWTNKYQKERTIKYWFDSIIDGVSPVPSFEDLIIEKNGINILCSHLGLIDVDIELAAGLSSGTERQHKNNFLKTYSLIKKELENIKDQYDVVLFDCPPNFSIVTKNALVASDYYLVPAKMDYLSTLGINQLRNNVDNLVKQYNKYCSTDSEIINPEFLGVVATMIAVRNGEPISAQRNYISTLERSNINIFDSMIRENKTIYASAPEYGTPVVFQSHSSGTYQEVVQELENLTSEFIGKVGI